MLPRFRFAGSGVNVEKTADVVFVGLNDRNQDGFAIGRPRGHVTVAEQSLVGEDGFLESAIRFCEEQIPGRRVVEFAQESEMLAVRGKGDGAVDILDQDAGIAAEYRCAEKDGVGFFLFIAADKVDVVTVGRKGEAAVAGGGRFDDFLVAAGGDVVEPEGLESLFFQRLKKIFAIRRNGGMGYVAVIGDIFDGEFLEGLALLCMLINS